MSFVPSVQSSITIAGTAVAGANLSSVCFATCHAYGYNRLKGYSSWTEVTEDTSLPTTSNAYQALKIAFSVDGGPAIPVYIGRRDWDDVTLTVSDLQDSEEYSFNIIVVDTSDASQTTYTVSYTSGAGATLAEISAGLTAAWGTAGVVNATITDNLDGSVTLDESAGYTFYLDSITKLDDTYTCTESAADLYGALVDEGEQDFYVLTTESRDQDFILDMASEVQASEGSDFPKQYHVCVSEVIALSAVSDPVNDGDTLGKLDELNYSRTSTHWHNDDDLYPEVGVAAYQGKFTNSTTYKFVPQISGLTAAKDPSTGKEIYKSQAGNIIDRRGNVFISERSVVFLHEGTTCHDDIFIDMIKDKDYINDNIETGLLNLLLNQPGSKISFNRRNKARVAGVINGVLEDAVDMGILSGYDPTVIPEDISFADQANRILQDVSWTGYFDPAIHTCIVSGILTYSEEELS